MVPSVFVTGSVSTLSQSVRTVPSSSDDVEHDINETLDAIGRDTLWAMHTDFEDASAREMAST